ncbi:hypothetical protein [Enterococcus olivae]
MKTGSDFPIELFEGKMKLIIGLEKGTFRALEPRPSKEDLVQSLKEEREVVPEYEKREFKQMIHFIENLSKEDFVSFYEEIPFYELVNDEIVEKEKRT